MHRIDTYDDVIYVINAETDETVRAFYRTYPTAMQSAVAFLESLDGPIARHPERRTR